MKNANAGNNSPQHPVMAKQLISHTFTLLNQKDNPTIVLGWNAAHTLTDTRLGRASYITPNIIKETITKTDAIESSDQDEISNAAEENLENTVAFQKIQLNPLHSQKVTSATDEWSTEHLVQKKKTQCKVSSRLKKPPVTKSDDFLY